MERQKKQLLLCGALLILIIGCYAGLRAYNHGRQEETDAAAGGATYKITDLDPDGVTQLSYTNENGSFAYVKADGEWRLESDPELALDQTSLQDKIDRAAALRSADKIEPVTDYVQYGLSKPRITVTLTTRDGSTRLEIGDYNETIAKYYLRIAGEDAVYTIDSSTESLFSGTTEEF